MNFIFQKNNNNLYKSCMCIGDIFIHTLLYESLKTKSQEENLFPCKIFDLSYHIIIKKDD